MEVTIRTTTAVGTLCLLSLEQPDGTAIPVARSYDGNDWERSGGKFAASLADWTCNLFGCASVLPPASNYVLVTRIASSTNGSPTSPNRLSAPLSNKVPSRAEVARFLQSASFGATRNDWQTWGTKSLAQHVEQQFALPPTYHRVYFRRRANPRWLFPHPEFAARLDPCAAGATWRRQVLTVKDSQQSLHVQRRVVNAGARWWEIVIGGSVRALVPQLRFLNANRTIVSGAAYQFCSLDEETHRGIYKVTIHGECHQLRTEDLMIYFPASYTPTNRLNGTLASLFNQSAWRPMVGSSTEYISNGIPARQCKSLLAPSIPPKPIFAQTVDGTWLQFDPRMQMKENSVEAPWDDGGTQSWLTNQTLYCSNVPRSFLNEASCRISTKATCRAGATSARDVGVGYVVCGSPGEVANNISWGDSWMDVSSITKTRKSEAHVQLPLATTEPEAFARQREIIWTDVVVKAQDQLRQRVALALHTIFALPKSAIVAEEHHTEYFLQYYDIFVRHAFGNYRDVLREVTYSPLMAESLTYLFSKSAAVNVARTKTVVYPDENYARELMQLFTIGLVELKMDGTPKLDANNETIPTYDSDDIMSFARAWTGFERNAKRANIEATENLNRIDPLKIKPAFRDRFPKSDLANGYIGDYYPLCADLAKKPFLRVGAKYRLLGTSPIPELVEEDWEPSPRTKQLRLEPNTTGLFEKLCSNSSGSTCTFSGTVVLDQNLDCLAVASECNVDTVRVVQIHNVFYEYVHLPCVEYAFYSNARKVTDATAALRSMCANPILPVASIACCDQNNTAQPYCSFSGERATFQTAQARCQSNGKSLCSHGSSTTSPECPQQGVHWTSSGCKIKVKVRADGKVAIVHDVPSVPTSASRGTQNYFAAYWAGQQFPNLSNNCGAGACQPIDGACLCDVTVGEETVFSALPGKTAEILERLRVGHAGPRLYDTNQFVSK
jgi:Protein of unknown function (DUF1800)